MRTIRSLAVLCLIAVFFRTEPVQAQTYSALPNTKLQFFDNSGLPLAGGFLYSYAAGTSTPQSTYSDIAGTPNANPVVLDSAGRANVFISSANPYKLVLQNVLGTQIWTADNVKDQAVLLALAASPWTLSSTTLKPTTTTNDVVVGGANLPSSFGTGGGTLASVGPGVNIFSGTSANENDLRITTTNTQILLNELAYGTNGHVPILFSIAGTVSQKLLTTGQTQFGPTAGFSNALAQIRSSTIVNSLEWGDATGIDGAGLGWEASGSLFLAFNAEGDAANSNKYKTRGIPGHILRSDLSGGLYVSRATTANAANQSPTNDFLFDLSGNLSSTGKLAIGNLGGTPGTYVDVGTSSDVISGTEPTVAQALRLSARVLTSNTSQTNLGAQFFANQTAATTFSIIGLDGFATASHSSGTVSGGIGIRGITESNSTSTMSSMIGVNGKFRINSSGGATNAYAGIFNPDARVGSGSGTVTNGYGVYVDVFGTGVTNKYSFYAADTVAQNYFGGPVVFAGVSAGAPTTPASGTFILYIDSADSNKLKIKGGGGTVTSLGLQ